MWTDTHRGDVDKYFASNSTDKHNTNPTKCLVRVEAITETAARKLPLLVPSSCVLGNHLTQKKTKPLRTQKHVHQRDDRLLIDIKFIASASGSQTNRHDLFYLLGHNPRRSGILAPV